MVKGKLCPPTESTPSTDRQKFITGDYAGEYICVKYGTNPSTGASVEWVKYNENFYLFLCVGYTPFREHTNRSYPWTDFRAWCLRRRGITQ